jgi:kynurenine formamidase
MKRSLSIMLLIALVCVPGIGGTEGPPSLWPILKTLQSKQFVDLTHSFSPDIPHWPGFDPEQRITTYYYEAGIGAKGHGFLAHQYTLPGQWGTHVDPPAHFIKGKRFLDEIPVSEMVLPLVVIDVSTKVRNNPDYQISMDDVRAWEATYGAIPEQAFVAMRTDWSKRWPSPEKMRNADDKGIAHYPGWSQEVLMYLYETRRITASGHETTDTDPGVATSKDDYSLESYVLSQDKYQIELLANLDRVPPYGAIVVAAFPKPKKGSGFPARVFAILP